MPTLGNQPDIPREGFYRMRRVRNGPFVAVRIWFGQPYDPATGEYCDRSYCWRAAIDGVQVGIWDVWPACSGRPICEGDYRFMRAMSTHAKAHEPGMPQANPFKPINLSTLPPIF